MRKTDRKPDASSFRAALAARKALAALLSACMLLGLLPGLALAQEPAHGHTGWVAVTMGETYIKLGDTEQTANTLPAGSYRLDADLTVALTISGAVDLCLNGHSVTVGSSHAVKVEFGGSLTLCDVTGSAGRIAYTGTDTSYYGIYNQGTLTLNSGAVDGAYWGVCNYSNSTFTMTGGSVTGKDASSGYGVYNYSSSSVFKLSGGSVSGEKYGIYNYSSGSQVYLSGSPSISGGTADIYTNSYSSKIYADDGAEQNAVPYSGQPISLRYSSGSNENTIVYHVTEDIKGKFTLVGPISDNFELKFSEEDNALQFQGKPQTLTWYDINGDTLTGDGYPASRPYGAYLDSAELPDPPAVAGKLFLGWLYKKADASDWGTDYWSDRPIYNATAFKADYIDNFSGGGSGTESDPYRLANTGDLQRLVTIIGKGVTAYNNSGVWYKLTENIDLSGVCGEGNNWTPIGYGEGSSYNFKANLDGNGRTISNLYINTSSSYQGLFGGLEGATVKNLTITGSVAAGSDYGALAGWIEDSTVENVDVTGVTLSPYGYTPDGNRTMAYKVDNDDNTIHIQGNYKNNWIQTTYNREGYKVATANLTSAAVAASAEFVNGGKYVQLSYTVTAGETAITDGKLAVHADIQIGDNDSAAVEVIQNAAGKVIGLKMVDMHSNEPGCLSQDAQFNLYFGGTGGVTPVDTYWFGFYGDRTNINSTYTRIYFAPLNDDTKSRDRTYEQDASGVYTKLTGTDSGFAVSWQNIGLAAGESKTYSFILGVGEKADPPKWGDGNAVTLTLAADATQDRRLVNVSAKVKDAAGLTDTLYYSVDGGDGEVLGEVTADGATMKDITGQLGLTGYAEGEYIFSFWVVNSKGAASASVERTITITADGIQGLDGNAPATTHKHAVSVDCSGTEGTQVEFTAWGTADAMPDTAGNYYLTTDVTLASAWNVPSGTTNLCLNGHVLSYTGNSYVINLQDGRTLNLCDCQTTEHKFTANEYGDWSLAPNGGKTVAGGVITGGKRSGVYITGGSLTMYGGNIVGNTGSTGAGVHVDEGIRQGGSFTMEGGTIQGNTYDHGAGVSVGAESTFTMKGGTIAHNTASDDGGGVYTYGSRSSNGTFNLEGGTITGNTAADGGGGVSVTSLGIFNMTGGSITGNTAKYGGGISIQWGSATVSGGSITGNTASPSSGGGGVHMDGASSGSVFNLSGAPVIKGNTTTASKADNIFLLGANSIITLTGPMTNTDPIGVNTSDISESAPVKVITNGWTTHMGSNAGSYANYFTSNDPQQKPLGKNVGGELTLGAGQSAATYTVTFNANGHGTAPASITNVTSGSKITAPTPPTAQGWTFGGWYQEAACTTPWVFETNTVTGNITLYAKWTEVPSNPTYDISGTVTDESTGGNATVTLMRGNTVISTQEITLAATGVAYYHGNYSFTGVAPGVYNVVATSGDRTKTILVVLTNANAEQQNIRIVSTKQNSVVEVKGAGTPAVVVGGVDRVAENERPNAGETVTVKLTVEKKAENAANNATEIKAVAGDQTLDFLELKLEKTVTDGTNPETTTDITDTRGTVIEIVVPFTFTNRQNVTVYRYHGDSAEALTQNGTKGGGTFRLDTANGLIYIYATKFSTYAIGYTEQAEPPAPPSYVSVTYPPVILQPEHGVITVSPARPEWGDRVTVALTPEEGYVTVTVTVTDRNGGSVEVAQNSDGTYSFRQPRGTVTVSATVMTTAEACPRDETCPLNAFPDGSPEGEFHDALHYCVEKGLLRGYDDGLLRTEARLTRGMMVQILYNAAGRPQVAGTGGFVDVAGEDWYAPAAAWAAQTGVVKGFEDGSFAADVAITREQIIVMLYRYATYAELLVPPAKESGNETDGGKSHLPSELSDMAASSWAYDAIVWAINAGLLELGEDDDLTAPITRAQAAVILQGYLGHLAGK